MPEFEPGTYLFVPQDHPHLGIGVLIPLVLPPITEAIARILDKKLSTPWVVKAVPDNNTFTVSDGNGPNAYKWIVKNDDRDLYTNRAIPNEPLRIESAGNDYWVIGLYGRDALLTADPKAWPQLTFEPANGSCAQRFKAVPTDLVVGPGK